MKLILNKKRIIVLVLIITVFIFLTLIFNTNKKNVRESPKDSATKIIKIIKLGTKNTTKNTIKAVGAVKADSKVSIVSMQSATVRKIYFNIGDSVFAGQRLVTLSENSIRTGLLNSRTDYLNRKNNLEIVKISSDQDIKSSKINLNTFAESLKLSIIQLKNAQDDYDNGIVQIEKSKIDLKNNSIISYNNNLSTIFDVLKQMDYILKVDGNEQISGIENVIAAKNKQSLGLSKASYIEAKNCYNNILLNDLSPEKALQSTKSSIVCIQKTKLALDDLIIVLDNTISSVDFSETALSTQLTKFNQLRLSILVTEANTKILEQAIENIEINSKASYDKLENALATANNRVNLSQISYENAQLGLEKTSSLKEQQILSAQIAVDSTLGQLNLSRERANDLNISSPINGIITKKSVEIGEEVSPGKMVAEVSQLNLIKIIINLPSEDAYKIQLGDKVIIEENFTGFVSQINPTADSLNKKVSIEIAFDNKNGNLIAETFVNLEIPIEKKLKSKNGFFLIPLKALSISQNENYVYIVENNIAIKKDVKIGEIQNTFVEIKSGLQEGNSLVIEGNKNLNNGDKIEIYE